jgi:Transcriptional regulators containing a DNA-binding HTH domain and an aminotransferase domain (MocR family) and their eukaryotic orthologs
LEALNGMPKTASTYLFTEIRAGRDVLKWQSLYQSMRLAVLDGRLPAGTRLPATRELARDLGVARGTVAQAYDLLSAEGFLRSEVGRGTYVAADLEPIRQKQRHKTDAPRAVRLSRRGNKLASSPYPLAAAKSKAVPFQPFLPALSEFPIAIWQRLAISSARQVTIGEMQDGDALGYRPLRQALTEYLRLARGLHCEADNVFIFSSTMQALDVCLRLVTDDGDTVACEDPCYRGASALFRANRVKLLPIPVDKQGMDVSILSATTAQVRLTYVTPAHQAPLGSVLSASRRLRLIEWAIKSGSIIFEDDYDGEYRYGGHPIPALQAHDSHEVVFHCGSFSKTLFPALRLAYLVVPNRYVATMAAARSVTSRYVGISDQLALTKFISKGHFPRHLGRMRKLYAERRNALTYLFNKLVGQAVELSSVEAGLQVACQFKLATPEKDILAKLRATKLIAHGVEDYQLKNRLPPTCVLGFAAFTPMELKIAAERFARVIEGLT